MQPGGVRLVAIVLMTFVLLGSTGCGALGFGSGSSTGATPSASSTPGGSWIVVVPGSATPSGGPGGNARPAPSPTESFLGSAAPFCPRRLHVDEVFIPITVVSGKGSFTVTWPRISTAAGYRIAAVPQKLIKGTQPPVAWKPVAASASCTITGTITGLTAGDPYIVWLDVLAAGYQIDGARRPYSGRSAIVYPG